MNNYFACACGLLLAILPACGFSASDNAVDAPPKDTGLPDTPKPATYGSVFQVTFPSSGDVPTSSVTLDDMDIDTDTSSMCSAHIQQTSLCVVAGATLSLSPSKMVTAHGSKPLILLATTSFDLNGLVDVSSSIKGQTGAGAQLSCSGTIAPTKNSGGFGGSFAGLGGMGADGGGGGGGKSAGKISFPPATLTGGCPGGASLKQFTFNAAGGAGGGAVVIISPLINLGGKINASGAAGAGGPLDINDTGGGGGGSGGLIILDSKSIVPKSGANIWLYANGGGGGQGGTHGVGGGSGPGDSGQEAVDPTSQINGGGNGSQNGGVGGSGAFGVHPDGGDGSKGTGGSNGGGGGGGGAGFVYAPAIAGAQIGGVPITP